MASINKNLADAVIKHSIDLLKYNKKLSKNVVSILEQLEKELNAKLIDLNPLKSGNRVERLRELLRQVRIITNATYGQINDLTSAELKELAKIESKFITKQINFELGAILTRPIINEATLTAIANDSVILGTKIKDIWFKQNNETFARFEKEMRLGIVQGETLPQLIFRVTGGKDGLGNVTPGFMNIKKIHAEALVRTSISTVTNQAHIQTYSENTDVVRGMQEIATLDRRVNPISVAYHGAAWSLPDYEPIEGYKEMPYGGGMPRHMRERDVMVPVLKEFSELGIKMKGKIPPVKQASMDGLIVRPKTFDSFLKDQGIKYQEEVLGVGRAKLWREGKLTLDQFVNDKGELLSLKDLERKYLN